MYTIPELRRMLGLSTDNQVRNRIDAIRDLLAADIRRGPNNQILLTERGLTLLRSLHHLCETGYTLREASNILRYESESISINFDHSSRKTEQNRTEPDCGQLESQVERLMRDLEALERRVAVLEGRIGQPGRPWWLDWLGAQ